MILLCNLRAARLTHADSGRQSATEKRNKGASSLDHISHLDSLTDPGNGADPFDTHLKFPLHFTLQPLCHMIWSFTPRSTAPRPPSALRYPLFISSSFEIHFATETCGSCEPPILLRILITLTGIVFQSPTNRPLLKHFYAGSSSPDESQ